jgi:trehalose 6-phosphate phosphatase
MPILKRQKVSREFFGRLSRAPKRLLFIDYDGLIAPFHPGPGGPTAYPRIGNLLQTLLDGTNTRLVLLTGRRARVLRRFIPFRPVPEIWGTHGTERLRPDGDYEQFPIRVAQLQSLSLVKARLRAIGLQCWLEQKPGALAVHWRGFEPGVAKRDSEAALAVFSAEAEDNGLRLVKFDYGLELRVATYSRATAVLRALEEANEDCVAAYLGNDEPDEDAFRALRAQDLGVLVRPEVRETAADIWVKPSDAVVEFLGAWMLSCQEENKSHSTDAASDLTAASPVPLHTKQMPARREPSHA